MKNTPIRAMLLASAAALTLSACGADEITQPDIVIGAPAPAPSPSPSPSPTPTPSGSLTAAPASACTPGTGDNGIITLAGGLGTVRDCRLTSSVYNDDIALTARRDDGVVYTISRRTEIGTDTGFAGTAGDAAILTIDPGVTIVATDENAFLAVNRGSRMEAVGTSTDPIIFTHINQLNGTVTATTNRLWGGLQLLGRAPVADCNVTGTSLASGNCERQVEGPVGTAIQYGGNDPSADAGTLRYIQILFSGVGSGGDELQGLTTGGVGSGTQIDFIQIHNSADDGIESFGGRQDMSHLVFTGIADDSVDLDSGYQGAVQYVIAVRRSGTTTGLTSDGTILELDSSTTTASAAGQAPRTDVYLANFTFISPANTVATDNAPTLRLRGGADISLFNGIIVANFTAGAPDGCLDVDNQFTVDPVADAATVAAGFGAGTFGAGAADRGPPEFDSVVFSCQTVIDPDSDDFEAQSLANALNSNVNTAFTSTLQMVFINGTGETAFTPVGGLSARDPFLESPGYIGAVRDANDTWYQGWTCDADVADLNGATACEVFRIS